MLHVAQPHLRYENNNTFLEAELALPDGPSTMWFSVDREFAPYLTLERADAFVVGLLPLAMELGEDILCEGPVSRRLQYMLNHYLLPTLAANTVRYHAIKVRAPFEQSPLSSAGAVGTGWSGGVDSFYTLMTHWNRPQLPLELTHLAVFNAGFFEGADLHDTYLSSLERARETARQYGLSCVGIDTNLHLLFKDSFLSVCTFRIAACALTLQKLFGSYLVSSAYAFSQFAIDETNSAHYDLMSLNCFGTDGLRFYGSGGELSRIDKLDALADFEPAKLELHPCINSIGKNCGKCGKCVRTQAALYALGKLEVFDAVFDVERFYRDLDDVMGYLLFNSGNPHSREALALMERKGIHPSKAAFHRARCMHAAKEVALLHSEELTNRLR